MTAVETSQRLQLARDLQRSLSPTAMPQLEGYDLAAYSQPAELVGGDCYDVALNGHLNLLIADATGHGLSAAVYMARAQAYLRAAIAAGKIPEEVFAHVNRQLVAHPSARMFVTALCVQLDPASRQLRYARAGHNPPLLVRKQQVHSLDLGAGPLGIFRNFQLKGDSVAMEEEDILVLYTDGVIEALNDREEPFGEERLSAAILSRQRESAQGILDHLADAVNDFISPRSQEDDITAMVLKVAGKGDTPVPPQPLVGGVQRPVALGFVRLGQVDEAGQSAVEAAVDQITTRREAVWEKLSEDAFLTVFGAPIIHEDDAARALEALCELRSRVRDLPGVDLRVGLHVGQAILKPDGAVEYSLIGEALNRAFELERQAGPGQLLLSDELRHLAGAYLDLSKGLVALAGVTPPAYELQDAPLERIERWQRAEWTETTPYVGRDAELQRLLTQWQDCSQRKSGPPRLMGIRGEAGLGKSRLLREFERQVKARHPQCLFLKGRALPYGAQPYALFSSLLQDYLGRRGEDRRAVLESKLEELESPLPLEKRSILQDVCPILGHLLGIKYEDPRLQYLDPQGLQQEIQLALRGFLGVVIGQSVPAPVILLEDLHWADAASVRLLSFLRENLETPVPPLMLATYRAMP